MSDWDWELRVSQRELHRLHVVRLTLEGRESVGRGAFKLATPVHRKTSTQGEK